MAEQTDLRARADELAEIADTELSDLRGHVDELGDLLASDNKYVRGRALGVVTELSASYPDDVVGLIDPLTDSLGDDDLRADALLALGNVADERPDEVAAVLPAIVAVIDDDPNVRVNATYAMASIAAADPGAMARKGIVDQLFDLLADDRTEVKINASKALGDIAAADAMAVCGRANELHSLLEDASPEIRKNAAYALGAAGPGCPGGVIEAIPELTRLADDPDPEVRSAAGYALGYPARLDADVEGIVESLVSYLNDDSARIRQHVTFALSVLASEDPAPLKPAVPGLTRRLADGNPSVRGNAVRALSILDDLHPGAVAEARQDLVMTLENLDTEGGDFTLGQLRGLAEEEAVDDDLKAAAERAVTIVESGAIEGPEDDDDEPDTIYCPSCGEAVDAAGSFCPACGGEIG